MAKIAPLQPLAILAAIISALFFVFAIPDMPRSGLDASGCYAFNQAVADHLVFGRDVLMNQGPWSAVYCGMYHPATAPLMLIGHALIAGAVCVGFIMLFWGQRIFNLLILPFFVPIAPTDALFFIIPVLFVLVMIKVATPIEKSFRLHLNAWTASGLLLIACAVGILPLVKGSFLGMALADGALAVVVAIIAKQPQLAVGTFLASLLTMWVGWIVAGQPISALPQYFLSQIPIISGYSEAMAYSGSELLTVVATIAALTLIALSYWFIQPWTPRWLVPLMVAISVFISFKAGFVRADGHKYITTGTFFLIALAITAFMKPRVATIITIVACIVMCADNLHYSFGKSSEVFVATINALRSTVRGACLQATGQLPLIFDRTNSTIAHASPLPDISGTADLYPVDLARLFARGVKWSGRPAFHSYMAYTSFLDMENAQHLLGPSAPDNVFFSIRPIDSRFPALEDAGSWPILMSQYAAVGFKSGYIQMVHEPRAPLARLGGPSLTTMGRLGQWVDLPNFDGPVWAKINLHPTFVGRIALALFRLPAVRLTVETAKGEITNYNYVPEMGKSGFLLSPRIDSTMGFLRAAVGDNREQVKRVMFTTWDWGCWDPIIPVSFQSFSVPPQNRADAAPALRDLLDLQVTHDD